MNKIVVFENSQHAQWAEEVARARGFAVEVIPAPQGSQMPCGMALEVLEETFEDLEAVFAQEGIPFKVYA